MAARKPLVFIEGQIQQIPDGDSLLEYPQGVEYLYNSTFVSETDPGEGHFSLGPENGSLNFNFHDYRGVDLEDWIFSSRVGLVRLESVLDPNNWLDFYVQS